MPNKSPSWRRYLRFWGSDIDSDVADELKFHIESRVQDAIAGGASEEQAHAEALKRFGDVERVRRVLTSLGKEIETERRRSDWLGELAQDLRVAVRSLRKTPAFTLVALITLALGIGANTAVFSVVNGVLLRPLPYPNADRVAILWDAMPGLGYAKGNISNAEVIDVRTRTSAFDAVGAFRGYGGTLTGSGEPEAISGLQISASVFDILGTPAAMGRVFTAEEDQRGRDGVIVLADGFWRRRFGADPKVLGRTLLLDGTPHVVIGILPASFALEKADAYIPLAMNTDSLVQQRSWHNFKGLVRLKKDVPVKQANAQLGALAASLRSEYPLKYPRDMGFGMFVQPLQDALVGNARRSLLVLLGAVALVLLIACVNVANLMLARAESRQREFAVRVALGARGGRLVRQLLTESTMLALVGGAAGAMLASWGVRALLAVSPGAVPRSDGVHVDGVVLLVTLAIAVMTGIAFGLVPALHAARPELQSVLRDEGRGASAGRGRARTRSLLIIAELALAVVVLTSAGLLMRSFWRLQRVGAGIAPDNVIAMQLSVPRASYREPEKSQRFFAEVVERVAHLPGVRDAAAAYSNPTKGFSSWDIELEGRPKSPGEADPSPIPQFITPRYFAALGIPLIAGRFLGAQDDNPAAPAVVINETFAKRLMPNGAVGKRFRVSGTKEWMTVVGVAADVKMLGPAEPPKIEWAANLSASALVGGAIRDMWIVARTSGDPAAIVPAARRELWAMDPNVNFADVSTMTDVLSQSVARPRFTMLLLASFAAVALVLAAVGVYGVIAYSVSQRTRELGIRMALGARGGDVMRLVVGQGIGVAAAGIAVGVIASLAATRLLGNLLFETNARDPITFISIATMLAAVAMAASFIPARRATKVDPAIALRE